MADIFAKEAPTPLNEEQAKLKRQIYDRMQPRRRKFVDKIGYENWDPFQEPNQPLDMRVDIGMRTTHQLLAAFMNSHRDKEGEVAYRQGALECAIGVITKEEKFLGIFDFCLWYHDLLKKEGRLI